MPFVQVKWEKINGMSRTKFEERYNGRKKRQAVPVMKVGSAELQGPQGVRTNGREAAKKQ